MAKVVTGSLGSKFKSKAASRTVTEQRVRDNDGKSKTLRKLDIGSKTFGEDLLYVFGKNVAAARRDNEKIIGAADLPVPASASDER